MKPKPIYRPGDNELLGYVASNDGVWQALTIFGVPFFEGPKEEVVRTVKNKGLEVLASNWEYFDKETSDWHRCIILEASKDSVKIAPIYEYYPDLTNVFVLQDNLVQKIRKT